MSSSKKLAVSGFVPQLWDVEGTFQHGFMNDLPDFGVSVQSMFTNIGKCTSSMESLALILAKHAWKLIMLSAQHKSEHYLKQAPNAIVVDHRAGEQVQAILLEHAERVRQDPRATPLMLSGNSDLLSSFHMSSSDRKVRRIMLFCNDSVFHSSVSSLICIAPGSYPYVNVIEGLPSNPKRTLVWASMYVDRVKELREWLNLKFNKRMSLTLKSSFDHVFHKDLATLAISFLQFDESEMRLAFPEEYEAAVQEYKNAPVPPQIQDDNAFWWRNTY